MGLLINDGCTLTHTIAKAGFPTLNVDYRPAMPPRVYAWKRAAARINTDDKITPEKATEQDLDNDANLLSAHLVNWDCGEALTVANLKRLPYPYFQDLLNVVLGYITPDRQGNTRQGELEKN